MIKSKSFPKTGRQTPALLNQQIRLLLSAGELQGWLVCSLGLVWSPLRCACSTICWLAGLLAPLLAPTSGERSSELVGGLRRHRWQECVTRWCESDGQRSPPLCCNWSPPPCGGHHTDPEQVSGLLRRGGGVQGCLEEGFSEDLPQAVRIAMTRGNPHHHQGLTAQHGGKRSPEGPRTVSRERPHGSKGSFEGEPQDGFYLHPRTRPVQSRRKGVSWGPRIR